MSTDVRKQIREAIAPLQDRQIVLIPALQAVQEKFGYLPEVAMEEIGRVAGVSSNVVYGVASFYAQFRFIKPGEHMIKICLGTACHVRGAEKILDKIKRALDINVDETTKDMAFTLKTVNCLGACALGPMVVVDEDYHGHMTQNKVDDVLKKYSSKI